MPPPYVAYKKAVFKNRILHLHQSTFITLQNHLTQQELEWLFELHASQEIPWSVNYQSMTWNPNVTYRFVHDHPSPSWNILEVTISQTKPIEIDDVPIALELGVDWERISKQMSFKCFQHYANIPNTIDWSIVTKNRNIPFMYIMRTHATHEHPWQITDDTMILRSQHITAHSLRLYKTIMAPNAVEMFMAFAPLHEITKYSNYTSYIPALSRNKNVTDAFYRALRHYPDWNYKELSYNPNIDIETILEDIDKPWSWGTLTHWRPREDVYKHPDFPWYYDVMIFFNHKPVIDIPNIYPNVENDDDIVTKAAKFLEFIKAHPEKPWNFARLSDDVWIPFKLVVNTQNEFPWDWIRVSHRYTLTQNISDLYPDAPWTESALRDRQHKSFKKWSEYVDHICHKGLMRRVYYKMSYETFCDGQDDEVAEMCHKWHAARRIQRWWLDHYYNPAHSLCQKRLRREFDTSLCASLMLGTKFGA